MASLRVLKKLSIRSLGGGATRAVEPLLPRRRAEGRIPSLALAHFRVWPEPLIGTARSHPLAGRICSRHVRRGRTFCGHGRELQEKYLQLRLSEADTRSYLIDPVLRLLGYSGVDDLRREVAIPATKESVDYELLVGGEPQVVVEAKALRSRITDQHAEQCVQYASVLGIRWCFISNGIEWLLYDAHAKGPLAEKRVAAVRLDGNDESLVQAWGGAVAVLRSTPSSIRTRSALCSSSG